MLVQIVQFLNIDGSCVQIYFDFREISQQWRQLSLLNIATAEQGENSLSCFAQEVSIDILLAVGHVLEHLLQLKDVKVLNLAKQHLNRSLSDKGIVNVHFFQEMQQTNHLRWRKIFHFGHYVFLLFFEQSQRFASVEPLQ